MKPYAVIVTLVSFLLFWFAFINQDSTWSLFNANDKSADNSDEKDLDVEFEVVPLDESEPPYGKSNLIFATTDEFTRRFKPHDAFVEIEEGNIEVVNDGISDTYFVGTIEGKMYCADRFEFRDWELIESTLVLNVDYDSQDSSISEVGRARTYFMVRTNKNVDRLEIHFNQQLAYLGAIKDVNFEKPKQKY